MNRIRKKTRLKKFFVRNRNKILSFLVFSAIIASIIPLVRFSFSPLSESSVSVMSLLTFGKSADEEKYTISDDLEYNGVELFGEYPLSDEEIPENSHKVLKTTLGAAKWMQQYGNVAVNNEGGKKFDIEALLSEKSEIKVDKTKKYQVLIVHSHGTESYNDYGVDYYNGDMSFRSDDNNKNMIHIGNILAALLEDAGYGVIHDKTQHDNPDYNGAYRSSRDSINNYLEKYPEIEVVLDIHRDTVITSSKTKYRTVTEIDGETVSQVMILLGSGKEDAPNEHWEENLKFSLMIQNVAADKYPGLMRPILLRNYLYNQDITAGSILVEVGTCGNSSEEAERGIKYFGECLIEILDKINGEVPS